MEIKLEDKDVKCISSSYSIMTINMNVKDPEKGAKAPTQDKRRELVISAIKDFPASLIFCQEVPRKLKEEVENNFGIGVYDFAFTDNEAAVMWRRSEFDRDRQSLKGTDSSNMKITESLKENKSEVDASEVRLRTAMVKLTSVKTRASFLAVSWHGKWIGGLESSIKSLNGLISFLCKVCEKNKLSSCIIGGDFNLNTKKVRLEHERATISISCYELCARDKERLWQQIKERKRGRDFTPYKDTFMVVSVTLSSGERLMTGDITVSSVRPLEPKNESSDNKLMDHVPVVGDLELVLPYKKSYIKEDRGTFTKDTSDKTSTTNEKQRPELKPETKARTAGAGSHASVDQRKPFEDGTIAKDTSDKTTKEKDRLGLTPETTALTAKVVSRVSDAQRKLKFEDDRGSFHSFQQARFETGDIPEFVPGQSDSYEEFLQHMHALLKIGDIPEFVDPGQYDSEDEEVSPCRYQRKNGLPDMRFRDNRRALGKLNKDGSPDMRFKINKEKFGKKASSCRGPLKKDGTPDMRFKDNWR